MPTQEENSYAAELEAARLEESLNDENRQTGEFGPLANAIKNQGAQAIGTALGGPAVGQLAKTAASQITSVSKAVATGQYAVWQAMWDFLVPSFGLSLFLVFVPLFSWIFKKTFPKSVADKLPEPGEDGMIGFVPPPTPGTAKFVTPLYGMVNKITMLGLALILILILMIFLMMIIIPPFLMYQTARTIFGPLGEIVSRIFGGL